MHRANLINTMVERVLPNLGNVVGKNWKKDQNSGLVAAERIVEKNSLCGLCD